MKDQQASSVHYNFCMPRYDGTAGESEWHSRASLAQQMLLLEPQTTWIREQITGFRRQIYSPWDGYEQIAKIWEISRQVSKLPSIGFGLLSSLRSEREVWVYQTKYTYYVCACSLEEFDRWLEYVVYSDLEPGTLLSSLRYESDEDNSSSLVNETRMWESFEYMPPPFSREWCDQASRREEGITHE